MDAYPGRTRTLRREETTPAHFPSSKVNPEIPIAVRLTRHNRISAAARHLLRRLTRHEPPISSVSVGGRAKSFTQGPIKFPPKNPVETRQAKNPRTRLSQLYCCVGVGAAEEAQPARFVSTLESAGTYRPRCWGPVFPRSEPFLLQMPLIPALLSIPTVQHRVCLDDGGVVVAGFGHSGRVMDGFRSY
ncbi:uncharacterized protein BJX67DRAFT_313294 [Aspergillus lucknowensis]|uniref:Uncharacterized protein n=1 Tax=Aspergillus lucknowensis TaxID=176173 RepID=A0ABR4L9H6_9EURO